MVEIVPAKPPHEPIDQHPFKYAELQIGDVYVDDVRRFKVIGREFQAHDPIERATRVRLFVDVYWERKEG